MNVQEICNAGKEDFNYICERLKEIRKELYTEHGTPKSENPYSRENMAELLGVTVRTIVYTETTIFSHNTVKLILIYQSRGYNPNWILVEDNDFINKKMQQENLVVKNNVQEDYTTMRETMITALDQFKNSL